MSKQLSIATALIERTRERQKKCRHRFITFPAFDFENDEVYYFGVCQRCGKKTE